MTDGDAFPPPALESMHRTWFKPPKRILDPRAGRAKCLSPDSECRICQRRRGLERHHLVPRSQGGDDVEQNLVPLCGTFEAECHRRVTENEPAALAALRAALWPEEEAYVAAKMGASYLDRRYPA